MTVMAHVKRERFAAVIKYSLTSCMNKRNLNSIHKNLMPVVAANLMNPYVTPVRFH